jgi:SAM-dependent methyltransferase
MEAAEYPLMDAAEETLWWYRALHTRLLHELSPVRGRLLDAGCGTGGFLTLLRSRRADLETVGLEFNESAAQRAAEKSQREIVRGSINQIPFHSQSFDAIVSADVLCHQSVSPERALLEFFRVLRPGGLLVINMPAHEWLRSAHDRRVLTARRLNRRSLGKMLAAGGFEQIRARSWNSWLLPLMILHRKVFRRGEHAASDVAPLSPWLNAILYGVTVLEGRFPVSMPAGGSVLATARRASATTVAKTGRVPARSKGGLNSPQATADVVDLCVAEFRVNRQAQDGF